LSPATRPSCPHDIGPGISVCLRCRQEERQLALARQKRALVRAGLVLAAVVVVAVIGSAAVGAMRASGKTRAREPLHLLASTSSMSSVRQQGSPTVNPAAPVNSAGAPAKAAANASTSPNANNPSTAKTAHPLTLKVPLGRTGLRDSMYVERDADSVVVHFDTELARTRRRDKFEATVRATLPVLYGAAIDSMLLTLPDGAITGGRDLVSEVAVRGVRLPVPAGGTLELWPVTRPGRDGPLVVGYRARVAP
jgi:hypothetical protein